MLLWNITGSLGINRLISMAYSLHFQLIYDVQDGGGSIGLLSTAPHKLPHLKDIGVDIPTMV